MTDPYNLYFTPDGRQAIVVAERESRLDLRDPKSWRLRRSIPIPFAGVDHLDFWANGSYLLASAEFSGAVVGVVLRRMRVTGMAQAAGNPSTWSSPATAAASTSPTRCAAGARRQPRHAPALP